MRTTEGESANLKLPCAMFPHQINLLGSCLAAKDHLLLMFYLMAWVTAKLWFHPCFMRSYQVWMLSTFGGEKGEDGKSRSDWRSCLGVSMSRSDFCVVKSINFYGTGKWVSSRAYVGDSNCALLWKTKPSDVGTLVLVQLFTKSVSVWVSALSTQVRRYLQCAERY